MSIYQTEMNNAATNDEITTTLNELNVAIMQYKETPNLYNTNLCNTTYRIMKNKYESLLYYMISCTDQSFINYITPQLENIKTFFQSFDAIIQSRDIEFKFRVYSLINELKQNNNTTSEIRSKLNTIDLYDEFKF